MKINILFMLRKLKMKKKSPKIIFSFKIIYNWGGNKDKNINNYGYIDTSILRIY